MSLYGSMFTAISGLAAQSSALSNVANNVANSQTTGYKRVDTNFNDYVTNSSYGAAQQVTGQSGTVLARSDYTNTVQGPVTASDNPLSMAISGQGFFAVSQQNGTTADGAATFDDRSFYTRAGDFSKNKEGYLVNSEGYTLNGWSIDSTTGAVNQTTLSPIKIDQSIFDPVPSSNINLGANLPADVDVGTSVSSQAQVYDSLGSVHTVQMTYTKLAQNSWQLDMSAPGATPATLGSIQLNYATSPAGTLASFSNATGALTGTAGAAGTDASVSMNVDYGQGAQPLKLDLGTFGQSDGLTQFSGTEYSVRDISSDGMSAGSFSSVSISDQGDVTLNYDNGQSRAIARVPVVTFSDPDQLQAVDGQAYLRTPASGEARASSASSNGAGSLVTSAVEGSNVDTASEFSKLILAQRAYTSNTKIITSADEMLQDTISMVR
ncbi:flagellar hook protein FlgE [Roseomonas elaeocarpi]|uniref:Flagellar hook protein FlgE n=1 Tax=Roseomonas elaeocarpi TaxID=907779 RepID=A0ABV6JSP2_9PROT